MDGVAKARKGGQIRGMKRATIVSLVLMAITGMLVTSGCVAVVAASGAAGGVAWVRGELQVPLEAHVSKVNGAIEEAGKDLGLHPISKEKDLLSGKDVFRNAQDEKITVTSEAQTSESTMVGIRVGMFGDQAQSQLILDKIRGNL